MRIAGGSGTVFRLQGGSLVEGENAPFDKVVYRYSILDGIRDGYLVPAFSAPALDKIDVSKLKVRQGEYTGESQDVQMLELMDAHLAQMIPYRNERRRWLMFEASVKATIAMCERMNAWGIRTGYVIGDNKIQSAVERDRTIKAYRQGDLQALVNKDVCTTGFDVPEVDLLSMRFKTKSLGKYIQVVGRLLRTIGGNIQSSIAAGKADGLLFDFGGNVDDHGPLDFIRPKETRVKLVSCDDCGARCPSAAARCWSCDAPMTKLCPACLNSVQKGTLDCPHCQYDMRREEAERKPAKLLDVPSGAALIASWKGGAERQGGWVPIERVWQDGQELVANAGGRGGYVTGALRDAAAEARWLRWGPDGGVEALLCPNGASRSSAWQVTADGARIVVPLPATKLSVDNAV